MTTDTDIPFVSHIIELRARLIKVLLAMLFVFCALFSLSSELYSFISQPILDQLPPGSSLIATDVTSTFFTPFKLTLIASFFLTIPVILYQFWSFISPGLYAKEKRIALPLLALSVSLFYAGIAFAHFIIFPLVMSFFTSITPENVTITPDIAQYLTIALKLFFAFGLAFEIPVVTVFFVLTGITTVASLSSKRPYIILICFVAGMLLTPPDPVSQTLLAIPMWLLFEFGLLLSRLLRSQKHSGQDLTNVND
ncbi:MAG: twin-arginine translocase subunit TatC [Pseudomonadota bacterium]